MLNNVSQPSEPTLRVGVAGLGVASALTLPEIAWELSLALYLTFKGFRPSSRYLTAEPAPAVERPLAADAFA